MITISIITEKGGVGKTTASIHLGAALAEQDYKVLLIDLDTQINLSLGCNIENFDYNVETFLSSKAPAVFTTKSANLSILPGSRELKARKLTRNAMKSALSVYGKQFDFVIIDCPPKPISEELSLGEIAVSASDYIISPILADKYSLAGITGFLTSIQELKKNGKVRANLLGFFFNIVEGQTSHFKNYYGLLANSPANKFLFKSFIRKDVNIKNAMDEGKTIFEIKKFGRAAMDYKKLVNEVLNKISEYEGK